MLKKLTKIYREDLHFTGYKIGWGTQDSISAASP